MTLYELLKKHSNEKILNNLHKYYDKIDDDSYIVALSDLRNLTPSTEKDTTEISVYTLEDEEIKKTYLRCSGIGPNTEVDEMFGDTISYDMSYCDWQDWLVMDIKEDCLKNYDELTILAGILWEMTFNGFTSQDVKSKKEELDRRFEDMIEESIDEE